MAREPFFNRYGRATILALIAFIGMVLLTAVAVSAAHPTNEDANKGGTGSTNWTGNWTVGDGDDLEYANQTIDLDGNLHVESGGRLVLRNAILVLHGTVDVGQEIRLSDGAEMVITDLDDDPSTPSDASLIKAYNASLRYYFKAYEGSSLTITNSQVKHCGRLFNFFGIQAGLYISTEDAVIEDVEISEGYAGLFIDGVDITVRRAHILNNYWIAVYVDNGGKPSLEDCIIEDNARSGLTVKKQSDVTLRDCKIHGNGVEDPEGQGNGVVVDNSLLSAYDCSFRNNGKVDINLPYFSQVELFNCTVTSTTQWDPIRLENSSLTSTNGNFDDDKVQLYSSVFRYQQWLTVVVTWSDSESTPIPDVDVEVRDDQGGYFYYTTDSEGRAALIPMLVVEYDKTGPTLKETMYNPFTVKVIHKGSEQQKFQDLRYNSAAVTFQYSDTEAPVAVPPRLSQVDVGENVTLDGTRSTDNVDIAEWNWSFEEYGQSVYLDGAIVNYSFGQAKVYTITLTVIDTSGNSGPSSVAAFDVTPMDRTPPTADAGEDISVEQGSLVTLDGTASTDNVGVIEWTWSFTYDGAPRSLTGESQTWTFSIPGTYTVVLTVADAAGLSASTSITIIVQDTQPPTTTARLDPTPPVGRLFKELVQVFFTVTGEAMQGTETFYSINGGDWIKFTGSLAFGGNLEHGDGEYDIRYYSQDAAGNVEEIKTIETFQVDALVPTFSGMDPPVDQYTVQTETYTIRGTTEPGAELTINGETVVLEPDGSFAFNATLILGPNTFVLVAEDSGGHAVDKTIVITRDEYKPQDTDGDETNVGLIAAGILAVIVIIIIVIYTMMIRKKETPTENVEWE
jgi:PKD repeat protein